ncbi:Uncharacterised protein [Enterobacter cloacae]|nr:Uncharacterised protein [Enterobacter cloacae]
MEMVTVSPLAAPLTFPLRVCPAATSAALMTSSVATGLMVTCGSALSTSTLWPVLALLPAASVTLAVTT